MFDIFNRKKIKELEARLDRTNKALEKITDASERVVDRLDKMERIVKYAGDEPSYYIRYQYGHGVYAITNYTYTIYLYIDKHEYAIEVDAERKLGLHETSGKLAVIGNIATIVCGEDYVLDIDYQRGTYIRRELEKEVI